MALKNDWTPYKRGIPHPSIYIIDRAAIVCFVEVRQNYVFRVKMNTILAELQEIGLTDGIRIKGQK